MDDELKRRIAELEGKVREQDKWLGYIVATHQDRGKGYIEFTATGEAIFHAPYPPEVIPWAAIEAIVFGVATEADYDAIENWWHEYAPRQESTDGRND